MTKKEQNKAISCQTSIKFQFNLPKVLWIIETAKVDVNRKLNSQIQCPFSSEWKLKTLFEWKHIVFGIVANKYGVVCFPFRILPNDISRWVFFFYFCWRWCYLFDIKAFANAIRHFVSFHLYWTKLEKPKFILYIIENFHQNS